MVPPESWGLGGWGASLACRMGSLGLTQARAMPQDLVVTARAVRTVLARGGIWAPPQILGHGAGLGQTQGPHPARETGPPPPQAPGFGGYHKKHPTCLHGTHRTGGPEKGTIP